MKKVEVDSKALLSGLIKHGLGHPDVRVVREVTHSRVEAYGTSLAGEMLLSLLVGRQ